MTVFATMTNEAFDAQLARIGRNATKTGFEAVAATVLFLKAAADATGKVSKVQVDRAKAKIGAIYNDDMGRKLVTGALFALVPCDALIVAACDKGNMVPDQVATLAETLRKHDVYGGTLKGFIAATRKVTAKPATVPATTAATTPAAPQAAVPQDKGGTMPTPAGEQDFPWQSWAAKLSDAQLVSAIQAATQEVETRKAQVAAAVAAAAVAADANPAPLAAAA